MKIHEIFTQISNAPGMIEKKEIFQRNNNDTINQIFLDCYDSNKKYGIHKFNLDDVNLDFQYTIDNDYDKFHKILKKLASRELSGNAAVEEVERLLNRFEIHDRHILKSILDKKLTIGLSYTTFTKLTGMRQSNDFQVTLATHLEHVKNMNILDGTWFASRKCDGIRVIAKIDKKKEKVTVEFISRQGKPIETLDNVKESLVWLVRNESCGIYYADGEGCVVDENGDEDFQSILKEIKRKNWTIMNPCYQLFDFVTEDEFFGKKKSADFQTRYDHLQKMIEGNPFKTIKVLKQEIIHSQEDFNRWSQYVIDGNWEGFMLRKNEEFKTGRIKTLLKVKKFFDAEYEVKDIEIGEMTTAEPGKGNVKYTGVKALVIEHKGCEVHVGSGLTKEQRKEWYADPQKIIGKTITVKYFEETKNQDGSYSLRFPILKAVYENGRSV